MRDAAVVVAMVATFAALVTAHVLTVAGLAWKKPRWRALAALVVLPLAPYYAWREGMRARAIAWVVFAVGYVVARIFAAA
jgi:hypothetical protein